MSDTPDEKNMKTGFNETVQSLFKGMDSYISAKTVMGEPVHVNDTIVIPLVDVSFGMAAGAFANEKSTRAGGGMKGKLSPTAVLVIHDGITRVIPVKDQDTLTKIMNAAPDFIDRIMKFIKKKTGKDFGYNTEDADVEAAVEYAAESVKED